MDEAVARMSKVVFSQRYKLMVAIVLKNSEGPVSVDQLCRQVGVDTQSSLQRPLDDLVSARLIEKVYLEGRVAYRCRLTADGRRSAFWDFVQEMYELGGSGDALF